MYLLYYFTYGLVFGVNYNPDVSIFAIAHEIGHSLDYQDGEMGSMGRAFLNSTDATSFNRFKQNCMRYYTCSQDSEAWADAFGVFVVDYAPAYITPTMRTNFPGTGSKWFGYNWDVTSVVRGVQKTLYRATPLYVQLHMMGDR